MANADVEVAAIATARVTETSTFRVAEDPIAFLSERPGAALEVLRLAARRTTGTA